jgi:hypothetical protein
LKPDFCPVERFRAAGGFTRAMPDKKASNGIFAPNKGDSCRLLCPGFVLDAIWVSWFSVWA